MDSEVKIDFTTIKHECESKVTTLKSEEKAYSVTSDYAEEDVASTSNSVATNNDAEAFDVLVSNEDVKPNDAEPITAFTNEYLRTCIKNLLYKLDRLKLNFDELKNSLFKRQEANTVEVCTKKLTHIIDIAKIFTNWKAELSNLSSMLFTGLACICKTLGDIKIQLSQLDFKATNDIIKIDGIIDYAGNHIKNIVDTLHEQKFKPEIEEDDCTVVCEIEYSKNVDEVKPEIIDIFSSDSESEVSNDKIMLKKEVVGKLDRLEDIETSVPQTEALTSSQKSKRHSMSSKRRRSNLTIDSDSSDESAVCFKQNIVSRKEKTLGLAANLRRALTDTSEESDTADKNKTPSVENKKKSPPVGNNNKPPPVRTSKRIKTPSQICSNSHCKVDNSIKACSSSWDHVHQLPRNKTCEPCEQSDEWDYSDESDSETTNFWQILDGELPKSQAISEIQREHKLALLGIRKILRSLVNC